MSADANVPVIAIDGPAASGKGTIAHRVAQALGFRYLDSGSLYRLGIRDPLAPPRPEHGLVAAELASGRGALADLDKKALADLIASLGPLPPVADLAKADILDAMTHDKKMIAGRLHFVLPTAIGATAIVDDVTEKEMKEALTRVGFKK